MPTAFHLAPPKRCLLIAAVLVLAALIWSIGTTYSADATKTQTVLIIDDSDPDAPFSRELRAQIHSTLDAEVPAGYTVYTEFLNSGHFNEPTYDAALQAYIKEKFRTHGISAIISVGLAALDFSVRLRSDLWPDVPIVFITFDEARARQANPTNTTGIVAPKRFPDLVKAARILAPAAGRIVLVGTPLETQPYRRQYLREIRELSQSTDVIDFTGLAFRELTSRLSKLPDDALIASVPVFEDASGHIHNPVEAMRVLASVANRPIVTDAEFLLPAGAAAGVLLSAADLGRDIGNLAGRILNGESAATIPVQTRDYSRTEFNAQAMARWNIREETLPPGSKILFREVTVWERYRWQILTAVAVLIFQSIVITILLFERYRRRAAEWASHQHLLEVTKMDRALTTGVMSSSIAHELNQPLTAIMNNAEAAAMLLNADPLDRDELKAIIADIRRDDERAANIITHLRMLLRQSELKPAYLALNEVLADSISLIEAQAREYGVTLQTKIPSTPIHVRADSVHIQQVILNLALNAIEAMRDLPPERRLLEIRLQTKDDKAITSISDSGPGIPAEKMATIFSPFVTTKAEGTGLGLSIARTIIVTYGGRIWAENNIAKGAIFQFSLNLVPATDIQAEAA